MKIILTFGGELFTSTLTVLKQEDSPISTDYEDEDDDDDAKCGHAAELEKIWQQEGNSKHQAQMKTYRNHLRPCIS